MNINGEQISNLRFADDIVLIANSAEEMENMIRKLENKGAESGVTMNNNKTKIFLNDNTVENMEQATYLSQQITFENRTEKEVNTRICKTWKKYWSLMRIFKGLFNNL